MKIRERKTEIVLIAAIILLIIPYAITILYALPSTDDFWMGIGVEKSTVVIDAFEKANSFWMGWGGMWFYEFLRTLLNPVVLFGATNSLVGVELLLFFCFFLFTMWILNRTFWKYLIGEEKITYALGTCFLLLAWFLNTEVWTEVFYWFCGSAYMWAMSFVMLTVALEIIYFIKPSRKITVALSILGAIACSFYSQAVFPCMIFLLFMGREILNTKKWKWSRWIPFGFFLLGALSSIIAPGNYARRVLEETTGWGILDTFRDTMVMWKESLLTLMKNPISIMIMVVFFVIGMKGLKESKYRYRYPVIPFIITLVCLYVTYFPVVLGYGGSSYWPNRVIFIYNMFAVLLFSASSMYLGGWTRYRKGILLKRKDIMCGIVGLILFVYVCYVPTENYWGVTYLHTTALIGQVKAANEDWKEVLSQIETSKTKTVSVITDPINTPIIKSPGVTADENDPNNLKVANYYKKDAVYIIWK